MSRLTPGSDRHGVAAASTWAEERVRKLAVLFGIPDGARYLNDCIEVAEVHKQALRDRDRYKAALELIAGGEYADAAENVAGDVLSRV